MQTRTKQIWILCGSAALALSISAQASVVVTQVEDRSYWSLWLLSDWIQQDIAHRQIWENHDVRTVAEFTAEALVGVDIVYVSPTYLDMELQITTREIDALEDFVIAGGRLILPGDSRDWVGGFRPIAARFGVTYGNGWIKGVPAALVEDFANPITNGPAGVVNTYSGASPNDELSSTNPDFRVLARWESGPSALGYLRHGAGEVVFLTDFNTWDNDMIQQRQNQILWTNLFEEPAACEPCDMNCDGTIDAFDIEPFLGILFGGDPPCDPCTGDANGDGGVDAFDIEPFLSCLFP